MRWDPIIIFVDRNVSLKVNAISRVIQRVIAITCPNDIRNDFIRRAGISPVNLSQMLANVNSILARVHRTYYAARQIGHDTRARFSKIYPPPKKEKIFFPIVPKLYFSYRQTFWTIFYSKLEKMFNWKKKEKRHLIMDFQRVKIIKGEKIAVTSNAGDKKTAFSYNYCECVATNWKQAFIH